MFSNSSRSRKQYIITDTAPISRRVRAEPDEMAGDALQLGDQHADVLHPLGHAISIPISRSVDRKKASEFDCAPR